MSRIVYISCDLVQRDLPEVKSLCGYLQTSHCVIEFSPQPGWSFYRNIEDAIDRCDALVAIFGGMYSLSMQLSHSLLYASTLNRMRFHPRPRLFGIRVGDAQLPGAVEHVELEWIDGSPESYKLMLEDLPERG
jgi:hypothetical protein